MSVNHNRALDLASQIVTAAANAGGLKLSGVPLGTVDDAKKNGELDGAYVAALLNAITEKIKTV